MKKHKYFLVIMASAALVIFFQNCGDIRLNPGSESLNSTSEQLSCVDPSGSSPTVVVSSLSETDQSILNAYVLETRFNDNQTLTSTRTFEWSFDENPQPAGASLNVNVAQLVACSTHKITAKWIDSCSQPQELTQIYTQYGEGCPPPPAEPLPEPTPTPTPPLSGKDGNSESSVCGNSSSTVLDGITYPANILGGSVLRNTNTIVDYVLGRGQVYRLSQNRGESRSIKITTGSDNHYGDLVLEMTTLGNNVDKFMTISTIRCDFRYELLNSFCGATSAINVLYYHVPGSPGTPTVGPSCRLSPNTTYYINIRNEFANTTTRKGNLRGIDSCLVGTTCGYVFQIH